MYQRVFIQKQNGDWLNENCFVSAKGFDMMGYEIIGFEMDSLESCPITENDIVHGGIKTVRRSFDLLGIKQPEIHHPQYHLPSFCNRNFVETTLGEIRNLYNDYPFFIKPFNDHKLFTGFVVNNNFLDLWKIKHLSDDIKVVKSEYLKFISEYRCFILKKEMIGWKNYTGDFKILPNFNIIETAIKEYKEQPIAYSIDFAVTETNQTVLIEINDAFSLGSYGLNPIFYCKMIKARWEEIMKNKL